jgi:hypothetical protein
VNRQKHRRNTRSLRFHAAASMRIGRLGASTNVPVHALRSSKLNGGISRDAASLQRDGSRPAASNSFFQSIFGALACGCALPSSSCGGTPQGRLIRCIRGRVVGRGPAARGTRLQIIGALDRERNPDMLQENQLPLTDRIRESLGLASSLVEAAKTADSQEQKQSLLEKAQRQLSSVRDWTGRVQDRDSWQD